MKITEVLKKIDAELNSVRPKTMDGLIDVVHGVPGVGSYGSRFTIVKYMGYTQGIRVYITGRTKTHCLPGKGKVYSVFGGLDKFKKAGWQIEND